MLPLRPPRPTRSNLPILLTHPTASHLPTPVESALNSLRSDISPRIARSPASTVVLLAVEWSIRTMHRWPTLPTTLTLPTRADLCTRNVSNVAAFFSPYQDRLSGLLFRQSHPRPTCQLIHKFATASRDSIQLSAIIFSPA